MCSIEIKTAEEKWRTYRHIRISDCHDNFVQYQISSPVSVSNEQQLLQTEKHAFHSLLQTEKHAFQSANDPANSKNWFVDV